MSETVAQQERHLPVFPCLAYLRVLVRRIIGTNIILQAALKVTQGLRAAESLDSLHIPDAAADCSTDCPGSSLQGENGAANDQYVFAYVVVQLDRLHITVMAHRIVEVCAL